MRLERFAFDEFHGVEALTIALAHPVVEDGSDIRVPKSRGRPGLTEKALLGLRVRG